MDVFVGGSVINGAIYIYNFYIILLKFTKLLVQTHYRKGTKGKFSKIYKFWLRHCLKLPSIFFLVFVNHPAVHSGRGEFVAVAVGLSDM